MGQEGREDTIREIRQKQRGKPPPCLGGPGESTWIWVGKDLAESKDGRDRGLGHIPGSQLPPAVLAMSGFCVPCGGAAWSSPTVRPIRSWGISSWARCPSRCPSSSPQGRADFAHLPPLPTWALLLGGLFLPSFICSLRRELDHFIPQTFWGVPVA